MGELRILLLTVYSPVMDEQLEEIGLASIGAFLRGKGFNVRLAGCKEEDIDYESICMYRPDIVGMPVYETSKQQVYRVADRLHELLPGINVCLGGCLPTYYHKEMMEENGNVDYIIRGEGEPAWWRLAVALQNGRGVGDVKNLTYRETTGRVVTNDIQEYIPDLNLIPVPDRDVLRDNKLKVALMSTSRGCRRRCSFCISESFWSGWRGREPKHIVDEMEKINRESGVNRFDFIDSSFEDPGPGCGRMVDIAEEILKRGLKISYYVNLRAEFHKIADDRLMDLLKRSGLCGAFVGIEAANKEDLRRYCKSATLEDNGKIIELLRRFGMSVNIGFINFNPYSGTENLKRNIDFLEQYGFASNLEHIKSTYRLYRATRLEKVLEKDGMLVPGAYDDPYRYRYADPRIAGLQSYVMKVLTDLNDENNQLSKQMSYFNYIYLTQIAYYRRYFDNMQDTGASLLIREHQKNIGNILGELNTNSAQWFRALIRIAEEEWSDARAKDVTAAFIDPHFIIKIVGRLNLEKMNFARRMLKLDPKNQFVL